MDKLQESVVDFETDHDELTREKIESARALLRHDHRQSSRSPPSRPTPRT